MFRITRGITLQQGPAFSPIFRFPDGAHLSLYAGDEIDDAPPAAAVSTDAGTAADEPAPSAENQSEPQS